jgi:hypothetical protein
MILTILFLSLFVSTIIPLFVLHLQICTFGEHHYTSMTNFVWNAKLLKSKNILLNEESPSVSQQVITNSTPAGAAGSSDVQPSQLPSRQLSKQPSPPLVTKKIPKQKEEENWNKRSLKTLCKSHKTKHVASTTPYRGCPNGVYMWLSLLIFFVSTFSVICQLLKY